MSTTAPTATEFATSADGTRIAFDRTGSGPVVVLVDGALCSRALGPSRDVAAALAERFTVVAYDRRGRGASTATDPYAPEREFEDLDAVIAASDAGDGAFVMGQSSGAALAYRAAAAGVPIRRLIGYEAPWVGRNAGRDGAPLDYVATLDALIADDQRGKAIGFFMVKMVNAPAFVPLMLRAMRKVWGPMQAMAPTLRWDARVMGADFTVPVDELGRLTVPTLVLCGGKAPTPMLAAQERIAAGIPGARLEVLPGQTHQVSPAALRPHIVEFFS